ncbi:ATP-binding cassette domain-containing protein [Streptomyces sp. OUCMDZ-3434]|uniref:ATP-binding cassette domain-containing protein n=1 Tax=Streptomyces sp. OUCMDZ-3434 TaxID=1535304 RepID=UPI001E5B4D25|nr:ATP-binding cassette domain-containing protein [Streptomyces sp. OUCMDZ-3434]
MRLEEVGKRYGPRGGWVLRDVDLACRAGETVAVVGRNGSGKSTLLRLAAGLTRPTRGTVTGRPRVVGYVPDRFPPEGRMSATAYLTHLGRVRGLGTARSAVRAGELLDRLALFGGRDAPLATLSKGNAQKVAVAQALLVPPGLLVLDEPWSGLDASAHEVLAELLAEVAASGGTVLFTDHRESVARTHATRSLRVADGRVTPYGQSGTAGLVDVVLVWRGPGPRPADGPWQAAPGVRAGAGPDGELALRVPRQDTDALLLAALREGWSVARVTEAAR